MALKGPGTLTCDPRPELVSLEPAFLANKSSMLSLAREQRERRGRKRNSIVSCTRKEFRKLDKANRAV